MKEDLAAYAGAPEEFVKIYRREQGIPFFMNAKKSCRNVVKKQRQNQLHLRLFWKNLAVVVLFVFAALALLSVSANAQSDKDNVGPLPEVLGKARSVQVASPFGNVSDTIPIMVPPGRRNVQPQLALTYDSMGGLGDAGLGWQIGIGSVSRWRGDGNPTVGYSGAYSYALAGAGGELRHTGDGVYRAKIESVYREFRFEEGQSEEGYWVMDNGEGVKHYFGSSANTRIAGELWMLDYVKDGSGNTITYQYMKHAGALYIDKIIYTGYEPTEDLGANKIVFEYDDRPERNVRISYGNISHGIPVREERRKRLKRISVFTVGNKLVRRYELSYQENELNGQSLLEKVTLVGDDEESRIVLRILEYGSRSLEVPNQEYNTIPVDLAVSDSGQVWETGARIIDVNGDGFADAVENEKSNGLHRIHLGVGEGSFDQNGDWNIALTAADIRFITPDGDHRGADEGVRLLDVNADGLPDLFIAKPTRQEVWINSGMGWSFSQQWTDSLKAIDESEHGLGIKDFDPGLEDCQLPHCTDYPTLPGCSPPHCEGTVNDPDDCLPEHCTGTAEDPDDCTPAHCSIPVNEFEPVFEPFALVDDDGASKGVQLADVNADGRVDIIWSMSREELFYWGQSPVLVRAVFLNDGQGWVKNELLTNQLMQTIGDFVADSKVQGYDIMDVNGDGLADIVRTFEGAQKVFLGTGGGWIEDSSYTESLLANGIISLNNDDPDNRKGQGLMPVDFDDDGLLDYLRANEEVTKAYRNTGTGWEESPEMTAILSSLGIAFNTSEGKATGTVLADIDGDGILDFVKADDENRWLSLSNSLRAGLLVWAKSAVGEQTNLQWKISTELDNLRDGGVEGLPTPRPVVTEITRSDGREEGYSYITSFDYAGGLFENRQFRGFAWSEQTLPSGLSVWKWYHQDEMLVGRVDKEEWYDGARLCKKSSSTYETKDTSIGKQVLLIQTDEETTDPGGSLKTRLEYSYDDKLNIISVYRDPSVDKPGDESTTLFTWVSNSQAGIWSLPARTTVVQGNSGPVLSEFIMYYDDLPEGQAFKGLPSKRSSLAETGESGGEGIYVEKSMEYDKYGNIVSLKDGAGKVSLFEYGDPTSTYRTRAIDPEGRVVESEYDSGFGKLIWDKDASGNQTFKEYDTFGRLKKVTLPGDEESEFGTRYYEYSHLGDANAQWYRVKETETPGESSTLDTTKFFDGIGRVYWVEREGPAASKVIMWTELDDTDNPIAISRPFFDGDAELVTEITRDKLHRPIKIKEPDGIELTLQYAGPRIDVVDRRGYKTSFYRNADGKTTEVHQWVDGKELVTQYRYDPLGSLTAIVDALGSETIIGYDALGRRVRLEDPNAGTYTYTYDGEGRLLEQTAPGDNGPTVFVYNDAGDLIRKEFPDGTNHKYTYGKPGQGNSVGRVTRVEDTAGVVEMSYDVRGNVVERRRSVLGRTFVTGYSYDSLGRIRRITYPDGFIVNYEYDSGGNLVRVTDGEDRVIATYTNHNAAGQLKESKFGNGVLSSFTYDDLLRMTSILTGTASGDTLQDLDYKYDAGSNISYIEDKALGASQEFWYDAISRLTKATGPYGEELYEYDAIGNLLRKGGVVFEVDTNHLQRIICGIDHDQHIGQGTENNPDVGACLNSDSNGFHSFLLDYDERGNVIQKGDKRFEYDSENHLVRVLEAKGKLLVENIYDAAGQRMIQETSNDTTVFIDGIYEENKTHASRHVRAGPLLVATIMTPRTAVQLIQKAPAPLYGLDGSGADRNIFTMAGRWHWIFTALASFAMFSLLLAPTPRRARRHFFAVLAEGFAGARRRPCKATFTLLFIPVFIFVSLQTASGEIVLSQKSNSQVAQSEKRYYYHSNHLGSINVVTDDRGKVIERRDYKPYGDRFDWTGPNSGPLELLLTFDGQRYDDATGFYYFGARHYDPEIGRFLTADTQVPDPMNPKSLHRYAFAGGNPIRYNDPTGHGWFDWFLGGIIIGVFIGLVIVTGGAALSALAGASYLAAIAWAGACVGSAIAAGMAMYSAVRMLQSGAGFSWKTFGMALAAGVVIGAAVGASIALLPYSIGFGLGHLVGGLQFAIGLACDVFVCAVFNGTATIVNHLATGGAPEAILTKAIGYEIATAVIKGAIFGLVSGGILNSFLFIGGELNAMMLTACLSAESIWEISKAGYQPDDNFSFLNVFLGNDPDWFKNSPPQGLGIPFWVFEDTWLGFGNKPQKNRAAPLLQTMPLAP